MRSMLPAYGCCYQASSMRLAYPCPPSQRRQLSDNSASRIHSNKTTQHKAPPCKAWQPRNSCCVYPLLLQGNTVHAKHARRPCMACISKQAWHYDGPFNLKRRSPVHKVPWYDTESHAAPHAACNSQTNTPSKQTVTCAQVGQPVSLHRPTRHLQHRVCLSSQHQQQCMACVYTHS